MKLLSKTIGEVCLITPELGEDEFLNAEELRFGVFSMIKKEPSNICIDFSGVGLISSHIIRSILHIKGETSKINKTVSILVPDDGIFGIFERTGLTMTVKTYRDIDELGNSEESKIATHRVSIKHDNVTTNTNTTTTTDVFDNQDDVLEDSDFDDLLKEMS